MGSSRPVSSDAVASWGEKRAERNNLAGVHGLHSRFRQFGEAGRVAGGCKGLLGGHTGDLMLTVTISRCARKDRHDDMGPEGANDVHHVA